MTKSYLAAACAAIAFAAPTGATAQTSTYTLNYTTFNDGQHPSVALTGTLTAVASQVAGAYQVTGFTGTRNGVAITDFDPTSAFYFPATVPFGYQFPTYFDAGLVTLDFFTADGTEYLLSRGPSDPTFYHEFEDPFGSTIGRLIQPTSIAIARADAIPAVPEPASWAMMIAGFAAAGIALRRRRDAASTPASA